MAKLPLFALILSCTFSTNSLSQTPELGPDYPIDHKNWVEVTDGWPLTENGTNTQFYYIKDKFGDYHWKVKTDFISKLKSLAENDQTYRISFKFWFHKGDLPPQTIIKFNNYKDEIWDRYSVNYLDHWMPCEYYVSYADLANFEIHVNSGDETTLVAIKDLKIEFQSKTTTTNYFLDLEQFNSSPDDGQNMFVETNRTTSKAITWPPATTTLGSDDRFECRHDSKDKCEISVDQMSADLCLGLEYSPQKETEINVLFAAVGDSVEEPILIIRPNVLTKETTSFCLKDLLALTLGSAKLTFKSVPAIDLKISKIRGQSQPFAPKTFLHQMKVYGPDSEVEFKQPVNWLAEWKQLSPDNNVFEIKEDRIHFTSVSISESPASAHLISQWIKYSPSLHSVDMKYSIEVTDKQLFTAFRVVPKICDELSHCVNTYTTSQATDQSSKTRTIEFNFPPLTAKYIKLLFHIEYFQPQYTGPTVSTLDFDLRLIHFGDPCSHDKIKCENAGVCLSDDQDGEPNKLKCDCDESWTGNRCQDKNVCMRIDAPRNHSPGYLCRVDNDNLECENWKDTYRCICQGDKVNWDGEKCVAPDSPKMDTWETKDGYTYPVKYPNSLLYTFKNINNKQDICLDITYIASKTVALDVFYQTESQGSYRTSYQLPRTNGDKDDQKICVRDFVYEPNESFTLSLSVVDRTVITGRTFNMTTVPKPKVVAVQYPPGLLIKNWNNSEMNDVRDQNWTQFPKDFFNLDLNGDKPVYKFTGLSNKLENRENIMVMLISNWIEYDKKISTTTNQYYIRAKKNTIRKIRSVLTTIVYWADNKVKSKSDPFTPSTNTEDPQLVRISIPDYIKSRFRVFIQITLSNSDPMQDDLDFDIEGVAIGDPCADNKLCNQGHCKAEGPGQAKCDCQGKGYGDKCQYTKDACSDNKCNTYLAIYNQSSTCIQTDQSSHQCTCWSAYYKWNNNQCSRFFNYKSSVSPCHGSSCEFLDLKMDWASDKLPKIDRSDKKTLPFYFTTTKEDVMSIGLSKVTSRTTEDFCFDLRYDLTNTSQLLVTYNDNQPLFPLVRTSNDSQWNEQTLCLSYLTKTLVANSKINIKANYLSNPGDPVAVHLEPSKSSRQMIESIPFLTHWSTDNVSYTFDNQWPIRIPDSVWDSSGDQTLEFIGDNHDQLQTSYIFSNWIKKFVSGMTLRMKFTLASNNFDKYVLYFAIIDETNKVHAVPNAPVIGDQSIDQLAGSKDDGSILKITIPEVNGPFRVVIVVKYNRKGSLFKLSNIDLGDPCTLDTTEEQSCNKNKGTCVRHAPVSGFECKCNDGYKGQTCDVVDWCGSYQDSLSNNGNDYCEKTGYGTCELGGIGGFYCTCTNNNNSYWDFNTLACVNKPKCLTKTPSCDATTQECREPEQGDEHKDESATCVCKKGYINVAKSKAPIQCERYDPCNGQHWVIGENNQGNQGKACGESNAQCVTLAQFSDYTCVCPPGYEQSGEHQTTYCQAHSCDYWLLNQCEQSCRTDESKNTYHCGCESNYDQKDGKCVLKTGKQCKCGHNAYCTDDDPNSCHCTQGYHLKGNRCDPNSESVPAFVCPSQLANGTDRLECVCGQGFVKNSKTGLCDLEPICSKDSIGRVDCSKLNALCLLDTDNPGKYECKCPTGTIEFNGTRTQCVNYCESIDHLGHGPRVRKDICQSRNAECDPTVEDFDSDKYCRCKPGYVLDKIDKKSCKVAQRVAQFELEISNPFQETNSPVDSVKDNKHNLDPYRTVLKQMAQEMIDTEKLNEVVNDANVKYLKPFHQKNNILSIIKLVLDYTVLRDSVDSLSVVDCQLSGDPFVCTFAIDLTQPKDIYKIWTDQLTNAHFCITYPGDTKNCFFPLATKQTASTFDSASMPSRLIINREKLAKQTLQLRKPCESGSAICQGYTHCQPDSRQDSTGYSCQCNEEYFNKTYFDDRFGVTQYNCQPRELCPGTCPPTELNGTCFQLKPVFKDNIWKIDVQCGCTELNKLSDDKKQCLDACSGVLCHHGQCKHSGQNGFACLCEDGWNGAKCDSQFVDNKKWIITVSVLGSVLLLTVVIATFCLVKVRRNSEDISFSSGESLPEYNTTSFRVGQRARPPVLRISSQENGRTAQENGKD